MSTPVTARRSRLPLLLLFGQAVAGLAVGLLWWAVARHPATWMVGEPVVTSTTVYPVARDGVFSVLTGLCGLVAGVVVVRRTDTGLLRLFVAALAGAVAGALLAAGLGSSLPPDDVNDPAHVTLHAWAVLVVQPFVVAVVVAVSTLVGALLRWQRAG